MHDLDSIFSEQGPLAQSIGGYRLRSQQLEMAHAVSAAIKKNEILIAEAGTGTGKTLAYLVPALLSGGKVILSTGTKTLQDQLFNRDIPAVRAALKAPVTVTMLKGRANYVCHYHLERSVSEGRFMNRDDVKYLPMIQSYARTSTTGDKGGLSDVPESASIWPFVTSTRDNCLGQECPYHKECFVLEARKKAQDADVVVVNHHLFFADVMLRDEGVAELLPACNTVIFDEAHQLPETASLFFGESISTSQLLELARDVRAEAIVSAKDFSALPDAAGKMDKAARDLRLVVKEDSGRFALQVISRYSGFDEALKSLVEKLAELLELLKTQAERSPGLENCWQRGLLLQGKIKHWQEDIDNGYVRWVEAFTHSIQLNATPLSIAEIFQKQIDGNARSWIFTSATLAVKKDFGHYQGEMGLIDATTGCWDSPFDYENQAILYVPQGLPEPNTRDYTKSVIEAALPIIRASKGRAFCLFTSLRAMKEAHEQLKEAFEAEGLTYPLLMQGEGSRTELLDRFRRLGNAVLLGSQSFWEGVDVRGEALSLVIIDKLPFAPPDDPVLSARIEQINREGRNAFMEYQLPRTVITLKQGAGRLIRDETDRGVLMICDPRLLTKSYGKRIWQSLPPMKRTRVLAEVTDFFVEQDNTVTSV
ncbi:ATP-dependent DNA helicase [Sulfurirhabdus autotrophica]|uniref:DNA 5'-3' helicase n=1 Tax=Sulfurirhabdus autotrophica TaxID=1706046 RepID=A0A4R3YEL8_9PROT|nr:ATP-dependent DNA helicase [Sulfurirhabdus autotrophica]TCV90332.1 ATP-dependent DNA helicase DinG [Sulfurirhabdus autotrophica]